ncbi:MAG: GDSL-type esterase/lipase family protein [Deltaproteobacteria bacterium]|jgi:lysophospholipase L1-like esterase|nr:GDSL-type esterase/lipase family protein [Deltaproteobacteria bacterium]
MESNEKTIVLLGDSLFAYHDGWDELDPTAKILNLGRGGDNTAGVLRRVKDACGHKPEIIFLEVGVNDLAQGQSRENVVENHLIIWQTVALMSPQTRLIVCSLLPINDKLIPVKNSSLFSFFIPDINKKLSKLTKLFRVEYIDVFESMADSFNLLPNHMTDDGIHLLKPGYEVFLDCLKLRVNQKILAE